MDRFAKESNLFLCFCGPPSTITTKLLSKLNWYDGTVIPYYYNNETTKNKGQKQNQNQQIQVQNQKGIISYCN